MIEPANELERFTASTATSVLRLWGLITLLSQTLAAVYLIGPDKCGETDHGRANALSVFVSSVVLIALVVVLSSEIGRLCANPLRGVKLPETRTRPTAIVIVGVVLIGVVTAVSGALTLVLSVFPEPSLYELVHGAASAGVGAALVMGAPRIAVWLLRKRRMRKT